MATSLYGFNRDDAATLKRIAKANAIPKGIGASGGMPSALLAGGSAVGAWVMQATTTITAASYSTNITPGSGTAKIMVRGATYVAAHQPASADVTETVYSMLPHGIPSGYHVLAMRCTDGDLWVVSWLDPPKAWARFTLGSALTTSASSVSGTLQTQYGLGKTNGTTSVTLYNLLSHTAGAYVFEGDNGDAGLAFLDSGSDWRIVQMECP